MLKTLYPKTTRIKDNNIFTITEKLDGSNLGFFKINGKLLIAQRNYCFYEDELEENKSLLYKGLYRFVKENNINLCKIFDNLKFTDTGKIKQEWQKII